MKFSRAIVAVVIVWAAVISVASVSSVVPVSSVVAAQAVAAQGPKSVWDGAYTEEQAKRGAEAYMKNCSECHQAELTGDGFAPALSGADFMNAWNGLTLGDLFDRIRISMPPGKESSVSNAEKIDIVAHILSFNKFPAGQTELPPQVEAAKQIKFEATKPGF
jgi:cytochrome c5